MWKQTPCFATLAATLSTGIDSLVLLGACFPGTLRNRLKAEKKLVMPAGDIWRFAKMFIFWWNSGCSGGFVILRNRKDGWESCTKTSSESSTDDSFVVQERLTLSDQSQKVLEGARALSQCFLPSSLCCWGRWRAQNPGLFRPALQGHDGMGLVPL